MDLVIYKGIRFYPSKYFKKCKFVMLTSLKRAITANSQSTIMGWKNWNGTTIMKKSVTFKRLRNNFFDRLRNRDFGKWTLSKLTSAVSYLTRNQYLSTSDKIYFDSLFRRRNQKRLWQWQWMTLSQHTSWTKTSWWK